MKSFTKEGVEKAKSALTRYFFKFGRQPSTPSQLVHFNKNSLGLGKLRFDIRLSVVVVCCLFVDVCYFFYNFEGEATHVQNAYFTVKIVDTDTLLPRKYCGRSRKKFVFF